MPAVLTVPTVRLVLRSPTVIDESSPSYQTGRMIGLLISVALIVAVVIWLVRSFRGGGKAAPVPQASVGDLATLGRVLRLHVPFDAATDVVGRVLAQHPGAAPATGPTPAWFLHGDGHLVVALVPRDGAAELQVAEVELPLRSPQAAAGWAWTLSSVQQAAAMAGFQTTTGQQVIVPIRQIGRYTSIGGPVPA